MGGEAEGHAVELEAEERAVSACKEARWGGEAEGCAASARIEARLGWVKPCRHNTLTNLCFPSR